MVPDRKIGVGEECPRCGSRNTRVRDVKRYPGFLIRRRYHECADCAKAGREYVFRTGR